MRVTDVHKYYLYVNVTHCHRQGDFISKSTLPIRRPVSPDRVYTTAYFP